MDLRPTPKAKKGVVHDMRRSLADKIQHQDRVTEEHEHEITRERAALEVTVPGVTEPPDGDDLMTALPWVLGGVVMLVLYLAATREE